MTDYIPNRQDALKLLEKYYESDNLYKHAFAVEGVMRHFAKLFDEDEEKWGVIGLIHDLDYDLYPDKHCIMTEKILRENNWPEDYIRSILSHGYGICTDVEPIEKMEKVLYTIDELTGLITATALMRPSKSLMDLEVKSVRKKFKDKSFAGGVNRDLIKTGCESLGMDLNDVIYETIMGMRQVAKELDLE